MHGCTVSLQIVLMALAPSLLALLSGYVAIKRYRRGDLPVAIVCGLAVLPCAIAGGVFSLITFACLML
jgi:hypothetical protein